MRRIWGDNLKERIPVHDELDSFIQSWPLAYICVWGGVIMSRMWCWSLRSVPRAVLWTCSSAGGREENLQTIYINALST